MERFAHVYLYGLRTWISPALVTVLAAYPPAAGDSFVISVVEALRMESNSPVCAQTCFGWHSLYIYPFKRVMYRLCGTCYI